VVKKIVKHNHTSKLPQYNLSLNSLGFSAKSFKELTKQQNVKGKIHKQIIVWANTYSIISFVYIHNI